MCAKPLEEPKVALENALLDEYLNTQGYSLEKLKYLPQSMMKQLMKEAARYAALKMEEIEARAQLVKEIHEGGLPHN